MINISSIISIFARILLLVIAIALGGCSTISNWFADDDELEIRRLEPIEARFQPKIAWDERVGKGVQQHYSQLRPALGYGMVYAASRQGKVMAFTQENGDLVWRRDFETYPDKGFWASIARLWRDGISAKLSGGMTVAYETLFFGSENGRVYALDARTGEVKWQTDVLGEVVSAPAVDENLVVVNTTSGKLIALDANSGSEIWNYEADVPPLTLRGTSAPSTAIGGVVSGTANGKLVVNLLKNGQTVWEQTIGKASGATELERIVDVDGSPLILGDTIYAITYDGTLVAVELRSGKEVWKREYRSYHRLSLTGNTLVLVDTNSYVYGIDRNSGSELWGQDGLRKRVLTAAEPVGDYLVVGDKWGFLHWLDASSGKIVARINLGGDDEDESIYTSPIARDNRVYVQTRVGDLFAIDTPTLFVIDTP
jgi:outer membrane protein assembly factor BamB